MAIREEERQGRVDWCLRVTKRLIRNYREIKIHADEAVAAHTEITNDDYEFYHNLMGDSSDQIEVAAIVRFRARSAVMLAHIDAMLQAYEAICYATDKPEDQRRYRVLEARFLAEKPLPIHEIAEQESINPRTVYKDIDAACEKMSALLFGVQWIERERTGNITKDRQVSRSQRPKKKWVLRRDMKSLRARRPQNSFS